MRRLAPSALLVILAVGLLAAPVAAEIFTVTLTNGTTIQTRFQPREADWSPDHVLILTEVGNQIALPRVDIVEVAARTEQLGFGKVIDTKTVDLGLAPNDAPVPEEGEGPSDFDRLQRLLQQDRIDYDQRQFVSPSEAGGGLPVGYGVGAASGSGSSLFPAPGGGGSP